MIGNKIKELRENKKFTQSELAKILKVSPSTIGMWEQNRRTPDAELLKIISDVFEVTVNDLVYEELNNIQEEELEETTVKEFSPIGERIKELRKSKGYTQSELGKKLGKSESTIRKYESGAVEPKIEILFKISKVLNIVIKEFDIFTNKKNDGGNNVLTEKENIILNIYRELDEKQKDEMLSILERLY